MKKRIYKVVVCRNCGHVQITYAKASYRCFKCDKTVTIDSDTVILKTSDPLKAREKVLSLKSIKQIEFKRLK
jgi:DNA-directed RNA polymerase subunit RPC12/RpoP